MKAKIAIFVYRTANAPFVVIWLSIGCFDRVTNSFKVSGASRHTESLQRAH